MSCANILDNDTTLVAPPTFAQGFECHVRASNHDAAAGAALRFLPNGTWTLSHGGGLNLLMETGNWHIGAPSNPGDYEVRITGLRDTVFTRTPGLGSSDECTGSYVNDGVAFDTGWVTLSSTALASVNAYAQANVSCNENMTETLAFTATIRQISNPSNNVTGSGSICAEADAMAN